MPHSETIRRESVDRKDSKILKLKHLALSENLRMYKVA